MKQVINYLNNIKYFFTLTQFESCHIQTPQLKTDKLLQEREQFK